MTSMLATEGFPEVHCTVLVMFCVLPSVKAPVAVNCTVVPWAIDGVKGVTAMERRTALITVTLALEEMLPEAAVTVEEPSPMAIASPAVPFALIPTTAELAEVHCTDAVMFCVLPSVKVPVAANCTLVPSGKEALDGETASEASAAAVTVKVVLPLTPEYVAVMVADPCALPVAMPVLEIVAAAVFEELQVAELVRSRVLWSL